MPGPVLLAVDGNSLVHRSFHAHAGTGKPAWAVRGLLAQLVSAVDRIRPRWVVIGFDDPTRSERRERWPQYKANRVEKLPVLVEQLALAVETMRALGTAVVVPGGLEADDVLASAARLAGDSGASTVIVSSDRDAFALMDENTRVLRIINGGVDASPLLTPERLVTLLGVRPGQYRDYAALRGDPSDNLPGVRGIGRTIAARLLSEFGSAAAAFADLPAVRRRLGAGVAARLAHPDARPAWELNCQVMALRDDLHLGMDVGMDVGADGRTDSASGLGRLPFDARAVARVFAEHELTWTTAQALRVLAELDDQPCGPIADLPPHVPARPRPPALTSTRRRDGDGDGDGDQLALFG